MPTSAPRESCAACCPPRRSPAGGPPSPRSRPHPASASPWVSCTGSATTTASRPPSHLLRAVLLHPRLVALAQSCRRERAAASAAHAAPCTRPFRCWRGRARGCSRRLFQIHELHFAPWKQCDSPIYHGRGVFVNSNHSAPKFLRQGRCGRAVRGTASPLGRRCRGADWTRISPDIDVRRLRRSPHLVAPLTLSSALLSHRPDALAVHVVPVCAVFQHPVLDGLRRVRVRGHGAPGARRTPLRPPPAASHTHYRHPPRRLRSLTRTARP